ncbi:ABC transporter substrate-binding protein [Pontivivens ytuae]|uniref:Iron-siderophore ABC transporter substrate-binding protein n=1 Tax=Pontivivens ytuae TaxID=2789856 RepID=A0A7S9QE40_9RHOB|nr:iron-siderophore ABC transporter substrate-binding protein [Pontivivens ytuae]QPH55643.1 iron-siderophore ABC transporter substrate-binding protein [Pontivivens ytuae]
MRLIAFTFSSLLCAVAAIAQPVEHAMGTTEVPEDPRRVVVLTNEGTEALLALGITPVGAAQSWTGDPWYDHIDAQMSDAAPLGKENQVNLELLAALEPDLILANKQRHEEIYPQLSTIAPTVVSERLRGDWRANFELYAEAVGEAQTGARLLAAFDERVQDLTDALGPRLDEEVSVIRFMPGHIRIYQKDSFSGFILQEIGFARPELQDVDEFAMRVGKESIPQMGGDRIFHFTYDAGDGEGLANAEDALSDPLWQALPAVQRGDVVPVNDAVWNTAGGILAANLMLDDIARIYDLPEQ